jgi:hypothetical protein
MLFHSHARYRKKKNFIAKLQTNDQVLTGHEEKAQVVWEFYATLLGTREDRSCTLDLEALGIPHHDLSSLDAPISEEEVLKTIKHLPNDKALGPDGFTGRFYKACWQTIKNDVMTAISTVWRRDFRNSCLLNSAFITLLPKKEDADCVGDFWPISLVHSFTKLSLRSWQIDFVGISTSWFPKAKVCS